MPKPSEHKTVQARILKYAEEIGWIFVPCEKAEVRRGFDPEATPHAGSFGVIMRSRNSSYVAAPITLTTNIIR